MFAHIFIAANRDLLPGDSRGYRSAEEAARELTQGIRREGTKLAERWAALRDRTERWNVDLDTTTNVNTFFNCFFLWFYFFHNSTLPPSRLIGGCGLTKVLRNSTRKSFRERNGIVTETCSTRSSSLRPYIKRAVPVILESQFSLPFSPFFQRLF